MRKLFTLALSLIGCVLFYYTFQAVTDVFYNDWDLPAATEQSSNKPRVVLILNEVDHPFWGQVVNGAWKQAAVSEVSLEVSGSFSNDPDDFLRNIEIAIYSKVDGIIVQGNANEKFESLTKLKAASYGIPIITVAHDVPKEDSLRKTYVGSNQVKAGEQLARQLIHDMGSSGEVILMVGDTSDYVQQQRLEGIENYLASHSSITVNSQSVGNERQGEVITVSNLLNQYPHSKAFVAVNGTYTKELVDEIETRTNVEPYFIYTFDEEREASSLLKEEKIDGVVKQSPEAMGKRSVELMKNWIEKENVPLSIEGYYTETKLVKELTAE
ncbi:sugar ABC transporter substrate-binding protein [Pontibacillus halophilus JSM 076056 = DSM 19796]|uniref:Sugar ABC transporter substrate-binding protein n=1 Tax=Pontibacillus halophilus JSM 076056 = DSM 19796 TaxID=1385510 RepID=A0A0A5ID06_9BACI|nr:substrate-binding domain-containing protein [Pontibacillus halophilus]KGX93727.1 sugar ABC transporter substrate-binding protein [Pontibacillus halophilus JSM 076056 = DSM 19796]